MRQLIVGFVAVWFAAWLLPLSCTFTVPSGCGCPTSQQGTLTASALGQNTATVTMTVGSSSVQSNVITNSRDEVSLSAPCSDNRKKLVAKPKEGKTWGTATCDDIEYSCVAI